MSVLLEIKNLIVAIQDKQILNGISLQINPGEMHAIMGPNGSGKSSLAYTLMGHPRYRIAGGEIIFNNQLINNMSADKRAKLGIFLAMQHPVEIEGVTLKDFLRQAYNALYDGTDKQKRLKEFAKYLIDTMNMLQMDIGFAERPLNVGFSGGEKKRAEMLQLAILRPTLAILDEIDSGLDVDALKSVCHTINTMRKEEPSMSFIVVTHYRRILDYLHPDFVHVLQNGIIVKSGRSEIIDQIEQSGYASE